MVTVLRAQGLRVVIYVNDHDPAHVHVFGDGEAKINLLGAGGSPMLIWADGMSRGEVRRALRIVTDEQAALLARWEEIRGRAE
jgi:Domain of unknown function (DUF4160)